MKRGGEEAIGKNPYLFDFSISPATILQTFNVIIKVVVAAAVVVVVVVVVVTSSISLISLLNNFQYDFVVTQTHTHLSGGGN